MSLTKIGSIGINTGIAFAGVTTIATLNGSDAVLSVGGTVNFVSDVSIGGTVSIAGTLTYEDVTNVDAVGLITARNGIVVGSGVTLSPDGDGFFTGVITATSYSGIDLSDVTGATGDFSIADKIVHTGDTDTAIRFSGADTVNVETGGSERLRVDSTGQVRIFEHLYLTDNVPLYLGNANDLSLFHDGTDSRIRFNHSVGDLKFQNNSNDNLMVLDASGRLLVGTTTLGESSADDLTIATSGNTGITIRSGTSNEGNLFFTDATSDQFQGYVQYNHSDNDLAFGTNKVERLTIKSDGEVRIRSSGDSNDPAHLRLHCHDTSIVTDDGIGQIRFAGRDSGGSTVSRTGALIQATAAATWDTGQVSGYAATHLDFFTQSNSGTNNISAGKRMRLTADGFLTHEDGKKCAFNVKGSNQDRTDASGYICGFNNDTGTGCFDSGGNFNTSTYKFVAPVSGYYHFFTNIRLDGFNTGYIRTAFLSTSYGSGGSYWENPSTGHVITYPTNSSNIMQISTSVVMYVPATHEVYVYQDPSSDTSYTVYLSESSFGGYFIG